jgi:hypothetical protein
MPTNLAYDSGFGQQPAAMEQTSLSKVSAQPVLVGLEGAAVSGMAFSLYDGRAT